MGTPSTNVAVVTGDVTIDWNLAQIKHGNNSLLSWNAGDMTRACRQYGGAGLLAELLAVVANTLPEENAMAWTVHSAGLPRATSRPGDERFHHSYALWSLFPAGTSPAEAAKPPVWRVEQFLGVDRCSVPAQPSGTDAISWPASPGLIVLDDAGLGFRDLPARWPHIPPAAPSPWILMKMACPVAQGPLWEYLVHHYPERLIVVMTVNDLRLTEVHISRQISWERTAQDLYWELVHNPRINTLSRCAHVIMSFDTAGALLFSRGTSEAPTVSCCSLHVDPQEMEDTWTKRHPGGMIGNTTCLTAGIARQIMCNPAAPDLAAGIRNGIAGMRVLHLTGYGALSSSDNVITRLAFPVKIVAEHLTREEQSLTEAAVQDPVRNLHRRSETDQASKRLWTILQDRYTENLAEVSKNIVLDGAESALKGVPLGRFGALLTADRREIESFRAIGNLIAEYCRQTSKRPLSIAVFGPPGAGKSFGVQEVANAILPGDMKPIAFNLSQFSGPADLIDAFHQVRDIRLGGKMPLVFWDEFDTTLDGQSCGWLRYFLAPMQDGAFQQGQLTHPIGQCIFVFAGGTSHSMALFDKGAHNDDFVRVKGPDFVSRLKGYIDILGPNPNPATPPGADPYFLIRRAILLRSILQRTTPKLFEHSAGKGRLNIDSGVLRALLHIPLYKHGARSLESIIAMSQLSQRVRFERSSLPPEEQLDVHVNGRMFLALVQQLELEGELLERLAAAAHEVYCEGKKRDGWRLGPHSEEKKTHPLLKPYDELPEVYKESNRATVRNIPLKLAAADYIMVPSRSNETPLEFPGDDLERLASFEHQLWLEDKISSGFTPGIPTPDDPKRSPYLVPWDDVPDDIKETDRDFIRSIPRILAQAGYALVRIKSSDSSPSQQIATGALA